MYARLLQLTKNVCVIYKKILVLSPCKVSCLLLINEFEAYGKINQQSILNGRCMVLYFSIFFYCLKKIYFGELMGSILNMSDSMAGVGKLFL